MKKFISAAATLAMAASMAVSAVPFTTGAADTSKTLEIRAFENASTTIDTTKDDVTVPVGLYIVEGTNDCQTISSKFTVHSKDGDASAVKFEAVAPGKSVGVEKSVTIDGETYQTDVLYNFAGEGIYSRGKVKFVPTGSVVVDADETGDPAANETNNVASLAWTTSADGTGYKWTGSKSDDYPIFVVNVTFPKGTKSGTYTIDFVDYLKDAKYPEIYSNLIEVGGTKYSTKNSNLDLKGGLEIKVNGGAAATPTEAQPTAAPAQPTAAPAQPTAAPAQPTAAPGTSTEDKTLPVNSEFKLMAEKDVYEIEAGKTEKELCLYVDPGTHSAGMYALEFGQLPAGFTIKNPAKTNDAAESIAWRKVGDVYFCDSINGGDPIKPSTEEPLFYFDLEVASTVADGEYTIPIKRLDVIESKDSSFAASVTTPIKVKVTGGAVTPTPITTAAAPTAAQPTATQAVVTPTDASQDKTLPVNSEFKLFAEKANYPVTAGSTEKELCLYVDPGTHSAGMYALEFGQLPEGFTIKNPAKTNDAAENIAWRKVGDVYFCDSINGGDPIKPSTEDPLFYFDLEVASTVADGEYTIPIKRLDVIESKDNSYAASVTQPIKITVSGGTVAQPTTAAPTQAQPTAAQPTEAQPTAAQPTEAQPTAAQPTAATNVTYGDTNCDGKVNIADVVILNKYLTDKTSITVSAQGLLNADCCDPTGTANPDFTDSKAIIKSIVHLVSLPAKAADIK